LEVRQAHGIIAELATPADEFRSGRAITNDAASMARRGSQLDQLSVASVRRI
jgi:hypothetical protein